MNKALVFLTAAGVGWWFLLRPSPASAGPYPPGSILDLGRPPKGAALSVAEIEAARAEFEQRTGWDPGGWVPGDQEAWVIDVFVEAP